MLDLLLLYFFVEYLGWGEVFAASVSFIVAITVNYVFSRNVVFTETERGILHGYSLFVIIALVSLGFVSVLMYVAVNILAYNYLSSRIIIAGLVGLWTYSANYFFNFRIHDQIDYLKK